MTSWSDLYTSCVSFVETRSSFFEGAILLSKTELYLCHFGGRMRHNDLNYLGRHHEGESSFLSSKSSFSKIIRGEKAGAPQIIG